MLFGANRANAKRRVDGDVALQLGFLLFEQLSQRQLIFCVEG